MLKFEKDQIYKFGVLSQDGLDNPNAPNPDFTKKPAAVSMAGALLQKQGIKTFDDFLSENPMNFPSNKIVHCYRFDKNKYTKLEEGNPWPKQRSDPQDHGLSDSGPFSRPETININPPKQDFSGLEEIYQNRVAAMEIQLDQKERRINELLDQNIGLHQEMATLKARIMELDIEKQKLEGVLEKIDEMGQAGGLGDGGQGSVLQYLGPLLQNEELVKGFGNWLSQKLGFNTGQQQPGQQQNNPVDYVPISQRYGPGQDAGQQQQFNEKGESF